MGETSRVACPFADLFLLSAVRADHARVIAGSVGVAANGGTNLSV